MADIFLQEDITKLLDNRFIVVIGDSIQRAVYKDIVLLLQRNRYLTEGNLRAKGEFTFNGDKLIEGGQYGEMSNGVKYREVRQYQTDYHLVRFYFVTRCYNAYMESILSDISKDPVPDVILMNSCLWDISRYGPNGVEEYKKNLSTLFQRFNEVLPKTCLLIWNTTLPISKKARGGFLIPAIEFMNSTLRLDILEANFYIHKIACVSGINVLDLHYFLRHQLQRRAVDGVHWDMTAHRRMTNLILTHIAQSWNVKTPENAKQIFLREQMDRENFNGGKVQPNINLMDKKYNSNNKMNRNVHWNSPNQDNGCFNNPNFFKQMVNNISSNFVNNVNNEYNNASTFNNIGRNMNSAGHNLIRNNSPHNLITNQRETLIRGGGGQTWVPDQDPNQQVNIDRYGGPIRAPDYMAPAVNKMMNMGNHQCVSQLDWQPYRNENLNSNSRYGAEQRQREMPYIHRGKRNNKYW